jgi:hypothetical protein
MFSQMGYMAEAEEVEFSPYFGEDEARDYALEVLEEVVEPYDLQLVGNDHTYVERPGVLSRFIPGSTDFAASVEGTRLRYNPELISDDEVEEAIDSRLEKARQEYTSWNALSSSLES